MELSLHRSRWGTWDEFRQYYQSQISPGAILSLLSKNTQVNLRGEAPFFIKKHNLVKKLEGYFNRIACNKYYLTKNELLHCCHLLNGFDELLNSNFDTYTIEMEDLRCSSLLMYSNILAPKLWPKDLCNALKVEHYLQNETIDTVKMEYFKQNLF